MTLWLRRWLALHLAALAWVWGGAAWADEARSGACAPQVTGTYAIRGTGDGSARPAADEAGDWVHVTLPDGWTRRWPGHEGSVWYRIDFDPTGCAGPVALGIDGISIAGAVYINNDLLWRDHSLVEPLSRSWNVPRWWVLPASSLRDGVNSVWVRAVGVPALSPGMGAARLGDEAMVRDRFEHARWNQRTIYFINAVLCGMAGVLFLLVWLLRRQESAYGWFAVMSLAWLAYLTTYLAESQWPFPDAMTRSRFSLVALIAYALSACLFTFRYGDQRWPWVERALWALAAVGSAAALLAPHAQAAAWWGVIWQCTMAVFLLNALQFQWHAWRPMAQQPRKMRDILLALAWLVFVVVALHDLSGMLGFWQVARNWAAMSGPLIIALIMLVLGTQLVREMRGVERFNQALADGIDQARDELASAHAREHAQALDHAKLQERMRIARDLHVGLGASLVRGMALVEQAQQPLPNERVLSLLKTLRDDLRQMIDYSAGESAAIPDSPVLWAAPLRHRFTRIFDELEMDSDWKIAPRWLDDTLRPSALQSMNLTRLVEEALSNIVRHSRATRVLVSCDQPAPDRFVVRVQDNGIGFDAAAVQTSNLNVGMRSMMARAARIGGTMTVESGPTGTLISVELLLQASAAQ